MSRLRITAVAAALLAAGCVKSIPLPPARVPAPAPPTGTLMAGFARVDITPPPGPSTIGYGPEGARAEGWRGRLYARAMVLQDPAGERIAIVQLDLGMPSVVLHREVAALTADSSRIGADALLLTATHTHSGPGHFVGVPAIDFLGGAIPGFDRTLVRFLATRIGGAVNRAAATLDTARAAWSIEPAWGSTRIRSFAAHQLNRPLFHYRGTIPAGLDSTEAGVDPDWRMLRVDVRRGGRWVPRGAWSIFAIHGTGIPGQNDLFDPDIPGIVSRRMEEAIDSLADPGGYQRSIERRSVFVFSNGAEGDVSPNVPPVTRCPAQRLVRGRRATGPRTPDQPDRYQSVSRRVMEMCMDSARWWTDSIGRALAAHALDQYRALGDRIARDPTTGQVRIAHAFRVVPIHGDSSVCAEALEGTGAGAGAEDGFSRLRGWKMLGFLGRGFGIPKDSTGHEGGSHCHSPKHPMLGPLQHWIQPLHPFAEQVQLSALRVGEVVIGTVPAEPTTHAGVYIAASMAAAAGAKPDSTVLMSLTNGYMHYAATEAEYRIPFYEGSSTEYGPREEAFLQRELTALAGELRAGGGAPQGSALPEVSAYSWQFARTTDWPGQGPHRVPRRVTLSCWDGSELVVRWTDFYPGRFRPSDGPVVRFEDGGRVAAWDDDNHVEVRKIRNRGGAGYEWQARWMPPRPPSGTVRVVFPARQGMAELMADAPAPGTAACRRGI
jgi:neutral ceramidase